MWKLLLTLFLMLTTGFALAQSADNPPREGFNPEGSDQRAIAVADEVMAALGGRRNWDDTRYITWKFFGRRFHVWDKWTGDIRVEDKDLTVLMNLHNEKGRAWEDGEAVTHPDSLRKRLDFAKSAWINDSYWMFMPYKLKDSGVTLTYRGEQNMSDGRPADVLELRFENVGNTPENKYWVYVDKERRLVGEWAFFPQAGDEEPRFQTPWADWKRYGNILLSADRGKNRHSDIRVFSELPESVFNDPGPVDWE